MSGCQVISVYFVLGEFVRLRQVKTCYIMLVQVNSGYVRLDHVISG